MKKLLQINFKSQKFSPLINSEIALGIAVSVLDLLPMVEVEYGVLYV